MIRGELAQVSAWARRGVVPVTVAPLDDGWVGVLPHGGSMVQAPYDDPLLLLAARRLPARLRPALGFFVVQDRAVITVHRPGLRRVRWVVWEPERAVVRPPGLRPALPSHVISVARRADREDLISILQERHLPAARMLAAVVAVLELPGARLLVDQDEVDQLGGAVSRIPEAHHLEFFEDAVRDAVLLRREMEQA